MSRYSIKQTFFESEESFQSVDSGEAVDCPHNKLVDFYPYIFRSEYKIDWVSQEPDGWIVQLSSPTSSQCWELLQEIKVLFRNYSGGQTFENVQESQYTEILSKT